MRISAVFDALENAVIAISSVLLVVMAVLMNTEIATRYFLGFSIQISEEFSEFIFAGISLMCFLPALRQGRFLQVQSLLRRMPLRVQAALELIAALIGAFLCAVLTYATGVLALTSFRYGTVSVQYSETPLAIPQALAPICLAVLCLAYLEQGVRRAVLLWNGQSIEIEEYVVD